MAKGGKRPGAGRKPGVPNKLTADVKSAIKAAFDEVGGQKYLVNLAKKDPRTFCTLVGKLVPTAVAGDPDGAAIQQTIRIITGVPDPD